MARVVTYTRLPTGHGHSDIDGCFAVVWERVKRMHYLTFEEYENALISAFRNTQDFNVNVVDVHAVADWTAIMKPHVDKALARLHKLVQTQHQWRWEAIIPSPLFPLGVKTTYRAYSSPTVVEFARKSPSDCITPIGRLTG